jgi:hypothetical protein
MSTALPVGSYRSRNDSMGSSEKISVSVGGEELAWAKKRAKQLRTSLSAVVSEALQRQRQLEAGWQLLDELGTDDITERDLAAIRKELGWPTPRFRPRPESATGRSKARRSPVRKP